MCMYCRDGLNGLYMHNGHSLLMSTMTKRIGVEVDRCDVTHLTASYRKSLLIRCMQCEMAMLWLLAYVSAHSVFQVNVEFYFFYFLLHYPMSVLFLQYMLVFRGHV